MSQLGAFGSAPRPDANNWMEITALVVHRSGPHHTPKTERYVTEYKNGRLDVVA